MNRLSSEQLAVVYSVESHNVVVGSVAGCGKTTTALGICDRYIDQRVLIVTYNSKLRFETRVRSERMDIRNCEIHTYHSLCNRYYTPASTDSGLIHACKTAMKPSCEVPKFNIIILDEQQDLDFICFAFIIKFIRDNCDNPKLVILGDISQSIYGFKGSDYRFLTLAPRVFNAVSTHPWTTLNINESFRVTKPIAMFVNKHILNSDKLISNKAGDSCKYILYNAFSCRLVVAKIIEYLTLRNYKPEDIFVLSFSIRSENKKAPMKIIENHLVEMKLPCYVPLNDDQELSEDSMKGKVTFSSFHQAKGRERKVVLVVGFDGKLINWLVEEKGSNREAIINSYYVACTRGSEQLFLLHHRDNPLFPTVDVSTLQTTCEFINGSGKGKSEEVLAELEDKELTTRNTLNTNRSVTDLFRFLSIDDITNLNKYFDVIKTPLRERISIGHVASVTNNQYEIVSDLYGTVITIYNEREYTKRASTLQTLLNSLTSKKNQPDDAEIIAMLTDIVYKNESMDIQNLVRMCNYYSAVKSGYISRWKQIKSYEWVDTDAIIAASKIINDCIVSNDTITPTPAYDRTIDMRKAKFKNTQNRTDYENYREYEVLLSKLIRSMNIKGYADIQTLNTTYEIKCTSDTKPEHLFQLAAYGCLEQLYEQRLILINVREGFQYELVNFKDKKGFLETVISYNCRPEITTTCDEFLNRVATTIQCIKEQVAGAPSSQTNAVATTQLAQQFPFETTEAPEPRVEHQANADLLEKLRRIQSRK